MDVPPQKRNRGSGAILVVGMLANSLFKAGTAMVVGTPEFRRKCGAGLLLYVALFAASWALL